MGVLHAQPYLPTRARVSMQRIVGRHIITYIMGGETVCE